MFEIKFNISKITILVGRGPDRIWFHTDLPDGCWPYTANQSMEMQVAAGSGADYVRKHFDWEPDEIIQVGV